MRPAFAAITSCAAATDANAATRDSSRTYFTKHPQSNSARPTTSRSSFAIRAHSTAVKTYNAGKTGTAFVSLNAPGRSERLGCLYGLQHVHPPVTHEVVTTTHVGNRSYLVRCRSKDRANLSGSQARV